jgi:hypothetical protein
MRISFANFIFYILHAILMFNLRYQEDPRLDIQCSGWLLKLCIWAGLLVGFFYVPSQAIQGYAQVRVSLTESGGTQVSYTTTHSTAQHRAQQTQQAEAEVRGMSTQRAPFS